VTNPLIKEASLNLSFYRDWAERREQVLEKDKQKATFFVTISREYGCEGYDLAKGLVEKLNSQSKDTWSLFTRSMINEMIADKDIPADMVQSISEKRWSFSDWFVDALVPDYLKSQSSHVFEKMRNLTLNLVNSGNCVILGAGSQIISQRLDPGKFHGVHIRVTAAREWKLARIQRICNVDRTEAEKILNSQQDLRDKFIADFTGRNAADPSLYNISFNNAKNTPDQMVTMIVEYLKMKGSFKQ